MRIVSVHETLPGAPVTNRDLEERFGLAERWLELMTGNRHRYFCRPDGPGDEPRSTSELAAAAGRGALDAAGVGAEDVDFVVLATASPDHLMPATVTLVADALGINDCPTLQITSGCAGALQALYVARALLASGLRRGLVIGADSCQRLWPPPGDQAGLGAAELVNLAMFGDGAGAVVVEAGRSGPGLLVEHLFVRTVGRGRPPGQLVRWYGAAGAPTVTDARGRTRREPMAEEDYKSIERHVPDAAREILDELTSVTGWKVDEVDQVLVPQLNGVMSERIREYLGVTPEQAVSCVAETGNNGNALPFVQLHRARSAADVPGTAAGRRMFLVTVESSKWIIAGAALRQTLDGGRDDR